MQAAEAVNQARCIQTVACIPHDREQPKPAAVAERPKRNLEHPETRKEPS